MLYDIKDIRKVQYNDQYIVDELFNSFFGEDDFHASCFLLYSQMYRELLDRNLKGFINYKDIDSESLNYVKGNTLIKDLNLIDIKAEELMNIADEICKLVRQSIKGFLIACDSKLQTSIFMSFNDMHNCILQYSIVLNTMSSFRNFRIRLGDKHEIIFV